MPNKPFSIVDGIAFYSEEEEAQYWTMIESQIQEDENNASWVDNS